jgi:hypothetical protein
MYRTLATAVLLAATVAALPAAAQTADEIERINPLVRDIIEEKVRSTGPGSFRDAEAAKDELTRRLMRSGEEARIGEDPSAESEIHAAMNPRDTNNIIVSPIRWDMSTNTLSCPIYYTRDFGATWSKSAFLNNLKNPTHRILGGGDPIFAFDADGNAYFTWIALYTNARMDSVYWGMYWAYSTDGGATWTREQNDAIAHAETKPPMPPPFGIYYLPMVYDKQWMAVDRSNSPYRNTVYTALVAMPPMGGGGNIILVRKPAGSAPVVSTPANVSDGSFQLVQFASIDVDGNGSVHVSFFGTKNGASYALYHSRSDDGGRSFSPATKISDIHIHRFSPDAQQDSIAGVGRSRLYPCPHIVVDKGTGPNAGTIYAVWAADGTTQRELHGLDIHFSRSTDNGATWAAPIIVNDDERNMKRHQFHPSMTINERGVVTVTWYDRRTSANDRLTTYQIAHSFDGGRTFSTNRAVTGMATDFASVGRRNGGFGIGEYTQVLSTEHSAIPFWSDGREGTGDLNVYTAVIPITESASAVERVATISTEMSVRAAYDGRAVVVDVAMKSPGSARVRLVDAVGATVREVAGQRFASGERRVVIDVTGLAAGQYFVSLDGDHGVVSQSVRIVR